MSDAPVVVVGAGLAGARTCSELRSQGFNGRIVMVGREGHSPYDRPPLSKSLLPHSAEMPEPPTVGIDLAPLDVDLRLSTVAVDLSTPEPGVPSAPETGRSASSDWPGPVVRCADGTDVAAAAVVIATGADPIVPSGWAGPPAVMTLRTFDDALTLRRRLADPSVQHVTVVGGSWLGAEITALSHAELDTVRLVERDSWLLPALPPEPGRAIYSWFEAAGIQVTLGLSVDRVVELGSGARVETVGESWDSDLVVAALGIRPATEWLADSGLRRSRITGAVRVGPDLAASGHGVFGVGDAVERWSTRYQSWLPGGHWQDALDEPVVVARSVIEWLAAAEEGANWSGIISAGRRRTTAGYDAVPYFWSELFGRTLQWTGYLPDYHVARLVVRGNPSGDAWTMCWLDDDDGLQAVLSCGRPRDVVAARKLQAADIRGLPRMDPRRLGDADTPIREAQVRAQ